MTVMHESRSLIILFCIGMWLLLMFSDLGMNKIVPDSDLETNRYFLSDPEKRLAFDIMNAVLNSDHKEVCVPMGDCNLFSISRIRTVIRDTWFPFIGDISCEVCSEEDCIVLNAEKSRSCFYENLRYREKVEHRSQDIVSGACSETEIVDRISNWICRRIAYDDAVDKAGIGWDTGRGNCIVFSCLFREMCRACNIPCFVILGTADNGSVRGIHEWNVLCINGIWFFCDLTWLKSSGHMTYGMSSTLWEDHYIQLWENL